MSPVARSGPVVSSTAARILLVEDAETIRDAVGVSLTGSGFRVETAADGAGLEDVLTGFRPDLVLLDVMLPGRDGWQLLDVVRGTCDAAVIMLTARDAVSDRIRGLGGGADDYVVKPFDLAELTARITAVLRRLGRVPSTMQIGDVVIDEDAGTVVRAGRPVALTATELRLLSYLARNRGRTLAKTQILGSVFGYESYDLNLVEVHVSALRRKLEAHGPRLVHTVRGLGYTVRA